MKSNTTRKLINGEWSGEKNQGWRTQWAPCRSTHVRGISNDCRQLYVNKCKSSAQTGNFFQREIINTWWRNPVSETVSPLSKPSHKEISTPRRFYWKILSNICRMVKTYLKKKTTPKKQKQACPSTYETCPTSAIPANKYAVKWSSKILSNLLACKNPTCLYMQRIMRRN